MPSELVKQDVPSLDLPEFSSALAKIDEYETLLAERTIDIHALQVTDQASYAKAANFVSELKGIDKAGEGVMAPYDTIVKRVQDFIRQRKRTISNRVEECRGILNSKMGEYTRREEAARKAEEERIRKETEERMKADAERKRKADEEMAEARRKQRVEDIRSMLKARQITKRQAEKMLREAGATEEADKARAAADAEAANESAKATAEKISVGSNVPTSSGVVRRVNYSAACFDLGGYLGEMFQAARQNDQQRFLHLAAMVEVSDSKLSAKARELKDKAKMESLYPYVKAEETRTF